MIQRLKRSRKILVVKIGAIGDVALALSMLQVFKGDRLTWVVGTAAKDLIEAIDDVHNMLVVNEKALLEGNVFLKTLEVLKLWKKLFLKTFDMVITAHPDPRYRFLSCVTRKASHRYFVKERDTFPLGEKFHGQQYLQLASGERSVHRQIVWPELSLPKIGHLIEEDVHEPNIVLAPGGDRTDPDKRLRIWPLECYVSLAKALQNYKCQVVIVGVPQDQPLISSFSDILVTNLIGKTHLLELIALCKSSLGIVTHDGGTLHLARLAGCQLCGIFGPTSPKNFASDQVNEIVLWGGNGLKCRPCYNGKSFASCDHQSCMKQVLPTQVLETIVSRWDLKQRENSHCP